VVRRLWEGNLAGRPGLVSKVGGMVLDKAAFERSAADPAWAIEELAAAPPASDV